MQLQRHDMVFFRQEVAARITDELLTHHQMNRQHVMLSEWYLKLLNGLVPSIVRRDGDAERIKKGDIPIGISLPLRIDGQRIRFASWVNERDILRVITPFQVTNFSFCPSSPSLSALKMLMDAPFLNNQILGVWGANALEIITGLAYTDNKSDLDIIVRSQDRELLNKTNRLIESLEKKFLCRIDVELKLSNDYGISLKEFFQHGAYVLGKGLTDVTLLSKSSLSI